MAASRGLKTASFYGQAIHYIALVELYSLWIRWILGGVLVRPILWNISRRLIFLLCYLYTLWLQFIYGSKQQGPWSPWTHDGFLETTGGWWLSVAVGGLLMTSAHDQWSVSSFRGLLEVWYLHQNKPIAETDLTSFYSSSINFVYKTIFEL